MKGSLTSQGFGHGYTPDLSVSLLLSVALHVGLLLLLSYSPFQMIRNAGQPTLISIDLAPMPEATPAPPAAPAETAETPPARPAPPPVEVKKAEPKVKPAPVKDDVVLKKVKKKPEPVREEKAPVEEAKPVPPKEVTPAPPKVASIPRETRKVRPATPASEAPAVPEEASPISALEGAREGIDASSNYYIQNLVAQIARRWRPPGSIRYDRGAQPVIVYFKIQKDGRITNISVETSSGRKDLDMSAERAVMETKSIPPLPPNLMQDDTLGVHFKFIPKLAGG